MSTYHCDSCAFCFLDAVRKNPICNPKVATDACLAKVIGHWLTNSRDRGGGRQRRMELSARRRHPDQNESVEDRDGTTSSD